MKTQSMTTSGNLLQFPEKNLALRTNKPSHMLKSRFKDKAESKIMFIHAATELQSVTKKENELLTPELKPSQSALEHLWNQVFDDYLFLARSKNQEALKRALFILWYRQSDPFETTGTTPIATLRCQQVLRQLEQQAATNALDQEFTVMLMFYYHSCNIFQRTIECYPELYEVCQGDFQQCLSIAANSDWSQRGLMGQYWKAVTSQN